MGALYATVEDYRLLTGDEVTDAERVRSVLSQQSAKLRAVAGVNIGSRLSEDAAEMARALVTDAARKQLQPAVMDGIGDISGAKQASFSANGFQQTVTLANPSGSAYFDSSMLKAFKRAVGGSQRMYSVNLGGVR